MLGIFLFTIFSANIFDSIVFELVCFVFYFKFGELLIKTK